MNHVEEGAYADDLFFRYGSQDQYTLFSPLMAPLVRLAGLSGAFFIVYLVSKSLLVWGMIRLALTLVPNRAAVTLSLMYVMAITLHYGGQHVLNVQENFTTPRMLSSALMLIGLDLLLRGRPIYSGLVIVAALAIHPLMAFGGLLVWTAYHLWKYAGTRAFVGATVGVLSLAALVLAIEPIGLRCFGAMDERWQQSIQHASSFNFPSQWIDQDWYYLVFQLGILGLAIGKYRSLDADKARFLAIVMLVMAAGLAGAVLAERLPYALLLQGQPYRVLWLLAFLQIPLAVWLCLDWSAQPVLINQIAGCILLAYLCNINGLQEELLLPAFLFPVIALALRGLEKEPHDRYWLVHSVQRSLVLGALIWSAYKLYLLGRGSSELILKYPEYRDIWEVVMINLGPIAVLAGMSWLLARLPSQDRLDRPGATRPASHPAWLWLAGAGCLALQGFYFAFPETDFYHEHCTRYRADLGAMRAELERLHPDPGLVTVYSNLGCLDYVWLDLHAKSYFDWWQAGNYMFRREMAIEGQRRACLVGPFELDRYRRIEHQLTEGGKEGVERFFNLHFNRGPSTKKDLAALCREPNLDYILLDQPFEGLYVAHSGRLYLYQCKQVRAALGLADPVQAPIALAHR
jgi:hypothetical protein